MRFTALILALTATLITSVAANPAPKPMAMAIVDADPQSTN
jgi:hypothetical protein